MMIKENEFKFDFERSRFSFSFYFKHQESFAQRKNEFVKEKYCMFCFIKILSSTFIHSVVETLPPTPLCRLSQYLSVVLIWVSKYLPQIRFSIRGNSQTHRLERHKGSKSITQEAQTRTGHTLLTLYRFYHESDVHSNKQKQLRYSDV